MPPKKKDLEKVKSGKKLTKMIKEAKAKKKQEKLKMEMKDEKEMQKYNVNVELILSLGAIWLVLYLRS